MGMLNAIRTVGIVVVLGSVSLLSACHVGPHQGIRTGHTYASGNTQYDSYFGETRSLQTQAPSWQARRQKAHRPLAEELGLAADVPDATLVEKTQARSAELSKSNGGFKLEITGGEARVAPAATGKVDKASAQFYRALEATANGELKLIGELRGSSGNHVEELVRRGHELSAKVDVDLDKGSARRKAEVREELSACVEVLGGLTGQATQVVHDAEAFVAELVSASQGGKAAAKGPVKGPSTKPGTAPEPAKPPAKPSQPGELFTP